MLLLIFDIKLLLIFHFIIEILKILLLSKDEKFLKISLPSEEEYFYLYLP